MANVDEEDLPKLVALGPLDRQWEIELLAEPGIKPRQGQFESIGNVLDPMQHTAIVKGWLDNPDGQLRIGQFVTATVDLPNRPGLVVVPTSSLIDDGSRTYVFVARDKAKTILGRREVRIARRGAVMAQLESHPPADAATGSHPQPIEVGEFVVTSGAIELDGQFKAPTQASAAGVDTPGAGGARGRRGS